MNETTWDNYKEKTKLKRIFRFQPETNEFINQIVFSEYKEGIMEHYAVYYEFYFKYKEKEFKIKQVCAVNGQIFSYDMPPFSKFKYTINKEKKKFNKEKMEEVDNFFEAFMTNIIKEKENKI